MCWDLLEQLTTIISLLFDFDSHMAQPTPQDQQNIESAGRHRYDIFHSHHTALHEE